MFRLKNIRYFRVSNRLALVAGLMLAVTALAGLQRTGAPGVPDGGAAPAVSQSADALPEDDGVGSKSRWKIGFLLFRHG